MNEKKLSFILEAFGMTLPVTEWKPFGHGHINDTYLIRTPGEVPDFILQRKNHLVFRNIDGMMNNIMLVTNHVKKQLMVTGQKEIERKVMTYITDPANRPYVQDEEGNFWTLCLFISGSHGIEEVTHPEQAFSAGKAFGHFQLQLAELPGSLLIETIPGFHNGKLRLSQLKESIVNNAAGRADAMKDVIDRLLERAEEMVRLQEWLDNGELPLRITHNDTKINNVMFDDRNQILCIIDLDTVMPGSVLFDFGDAIRTLGNTAPEDESELTRIAFNRDYYKAFAEGYLSESGRFLTVKERENLAFGCRYMVWEQAIRFLADYLNGDTYYKIGYPEHNRVRTEAQLRYLEVMEENYSYMKSVTGQ